VLAGRSAFVTLDVLGDLTVDYPEIVNHVISEAVHPDARGHWDEDYVNSALLGRLTRSAHDLLERELGCTRDRYLRHVSHPAALSTAERALVWALVPTWQGTVAELYETAQELSRKPS
jgi:hypothetical protein